MHRNTLFFIACLLSSVLPIAAQTIDKNVYTTENGLPDNTCFSITTDSLGHIIVATDDGLAKFNGSRFEVYRTEEGLQSNFPISIDVEPNNEIWVGSWKGGVNYLQGDSVFSPIAPDQFTYISYLQKEDSMLIISDNKYYYSLFAKKHGLWVKMLHHSKFKLQQHRSDPQKLVFTYGTTDVKDLHVFIDEEKKPIVYGFLPGLWIEEEPGILQPYLERVTDGDTISHMEYDQNHHLWITSKNTIKEVFPFGLVRVYPNHTKTKIIRTLRYSENELLFITGKEGIDSYGLYRLDLDNGRITDLTTILGKEIIPTDIAVDFEKSLWIATHVNGVIRLANRSFQKIPQTSDLAINSLNLDAAGAIYASHPANLLKIDEDGTIQHLPVEDQLMIGKIINYRDTMMFVGENESTKAVHLYTIDDQKITQAKSGLHLGNTIKAFGDKIYDDIHSVVRTFGNPLDSMRQMYNITERLVDISDYFMYKGTVHAATNRGLFVIKDELLQPLTNIPWATALRETAITCTSVKDGVLWLGTKRGLIQIHEDTATYFSTSDGLISNIITTLYQDSEGQLWVGTPNGLSIFTEGRFYSFNKSLGLSSSTIKCLLEDKMRHMWIGTGDGLNKVAIDDIHTFSPPPKPEIEAITVNQKKVPLGQEIMLDANGEIAIAFDAITFDHNDDLSYQVQFNDNQWAAVTEPTVFYQNLQFGEYSVRFRTRKINSDWSAVQQVDFSVLRPIWMSPIALIAYVLVLVLAVWLIIKIRTKRLESEKTKLAMRVFDRTIDLEVQKREIYLQARKLKEISDLRTDFYTNISHEFRTPLTLIKGPAEKIKTQIGDPTLGRYSDLILQNSKRLLKLINELLEHSKKEYGQIPFKPRQGDIAMFSKSLAESFEVLSSQKGIIFVFAYDSHCNYITDFDPEIIETILINLLSNAVKFTPRGGQVKLSVEMAPDTIDLVVEDTGVGISKEQIPRIFDRYFHQDAGITDDLTGTGIGLYLVKELVERHLGKITVKSMPNYGTTFSITVPRKYANPSNETITQFTTGNTIVSPSDPAAPKDDGMNILVVEDHPDLRAFIVAELSSEFHVAEAQHGMEGLTIARANMPDLIISDIMMPEMDGFEMLKRLRNSKETCHIPVIMLTAKASMETKLSALESGINDYLTKPFDANELLLRVRNTLETITRTRERFQSHMAQPHLSVEPSKITVTSMDEKFIENALCIVENHMGNSELDVTLFCNEIGMSKTTLHRKLKALTGQSTTEFIRTIRLKRAANLLEDHFGRVDEIATAVGFNDISFFNRSFKKQFNCTPSEYVKTAAE